MNKVVKLKESLNQITKQGESMTDTLIRAYRRGTPSDQQDEAIDRFFNPDDLYWKEAGLSKKLASGDDEGTVMAIDYFLANSEAPDHIIQMLNDWKEEGF